MTLEENGWISWVCVSEGKSVGGRVILGEVMNFSKSFNLSIS